MNKLYDLVVTVKEYTNAQGENKRLYENVGSIMEKDGNKFMMLKRHFNPAGITNPENKDTLLISMYEPKNKQQTSNQSSNDSFDDDTPF